MKNNIIYLNKLHLHANDRENQSYCDRICNSENSVFMCDMIDRKNICPECLEVVKTLTCGNCSSNENGLCETMNAAVHDDARACFMHTRCE